MGLCQTGPRQTNLRQTQLPRLKRRQLLQPRRRDWRAGGRASGPARNWVDVGFPDRLHGAVDAIAALVTDAIDKRFRLDT
jgi:hypothetical protein